MKHFSILVYFLVVSEFMIAVLIFGSLILLKKKCGGLLDVLSCNHNFMGAVFQCHQTSCNNVQLQELTSEYVGGTATD